MVFETVDAMRALCPQTVEEKVCDAARPQIGAIQLWRPEKGNNHLQSFQKNVSGVNLVVEISANLKRNFGVLRRRKIKFVESSKYGIERMQPILNENDKAGMLEGNKN